MKRGFWLSRTVGGFAAGVVMAGAGVGVALAGASGDSNQYTPGAKPYAGQRPQDITIGTVTITNPLITTTIPVPTVTSVYTSTVTSPYTTTVTTPYTTTVITPYTTTETGPTTTETGTTTTVTGPTTTETGPTSTETVTNSQTSTNTSTRTVVGPGTTTTAPGSTQVFTEPGGAVDALVNALLKSDLRMLLQPPAADLSTARLARFSRLGLAFTSPGVSGLEVVWKLSVSGKRSVDLVHYTGVLRRVGDITVKLPFTSAGRKLLKESERRSGRISATVILFESRTSRLSVSRSYGLKG